MQRRQIAASAVVIGTVVSHYFLKYFFAYCILGVGHYRQLSSVQRTWLIQISSLALCLIVTFLLAGRSFKRSLHLLGLDRGILLPFGAAVFCCMPMFLGGYYSASAVTPTLNDFIWYAGWPGFNEELVFRAFLAGLLIRLCGWRLVPAMLLSGLLFAWGHLYQAHDAREALMIFLFTSGAGMGFTIFYRMWNWNIFFTIFLHILMNLCWLISFSGQNVLLNGRLNLFRGITIGLAIACSIAVLIQRRRKEAQLAVASQAK
jgi:hypothetical protein